MKSRLVDGFGNHEAQAAHRFDADRHAEQRRAPAAAETLARRQHRRHDDRAAVHRPAFERIVEILAVPRGAVDHRRVLGAEFAAMADRAARAAAIDAGDQRLDVIRVARGDAQARDIDQQFFGARADRRRNLLGVERRDAIDQTLADGLALIGRRLHRVARLRTHARGHLNSGFL